MQTIHPLLVHFPIAMASLYAILEIGSLIPFIKKMNLDMTKTILLGVGFGFGILSSMTGENIEHSFPAMRNLVESHATWASTTNIFAGILFVLYLAHMLQPWLEKQTLNPKLKSFLDKILKLIEKIHTIRWLFILLAVALLVTITVTGALGAAIVHGPNVDPVVKYMYTLFVR